MSTEGEIPCPNGCAINPTELRRVHYYGPHRTAVYRCPKCHKRFSQRITSVFIGFHLDDPTIYRVLKALCEGNGIRATARIFDINRKTVERILDHAAAHCQKVSEKLIQNYHLKECPLDELWSFVKKRKRVYRRWKS